MSEGDDKNIEIKSSLFQDVQQQQEQLIPLTLTHVEYLKGDFFGYILAWFSLLPIFLLVSFVTLIIFRRDLHTICYFVGILLNEITNWVLKHVIREYRPDRYRLGLTTEYGMPSSHAQFMWFFSTYLVCFLLIRVRNNVNAIDNLWKYVTCLGAVIASCLILYSRVYLEYHTNSQVLFGAAVGFCLGGIWFAIVHLVFTPFFPAVASWPISELFMIRDSSLIPNVMWFEYTCHRSEARSRQRKLTSRKSQ